MASIGREGERDESEHLEISAIMAGDVQSKPHGGCFSIKVVFSDDQGQEYGFPPGNILQY